MNLNWERLSMSAYFEALEAFIALKNPDSGKLSGDDADRLRAFNKAHGLG